MTARDYARQFDRLSADYDARWGATCGRAHLLALEHALACGTLPDVVLDVGSGTGTLLIEAARRWPSSRLIGVDPSAGMLACARKKAPKVEFLLAPVIDLPLPNASVDLALSTTSFCCWGDQLRGLSEVERVLRPGGVCVVVDHVPPWLGAKVAMAVTLGARDVFHLRSRRQIGRLVERTALQVLRLETHHGFNILAARKPAANGADRPQVHRSPGPAAQSKSRAASLIGG